MLFVSFLFPLILFSLYYLSVTIFGSLFFFFPFSHLLGVLHARFQKKDIIQAMSFISHSALSMLSTFFFSRRRDLFFLFFLMLTFISFLWYPGRLRSHPWAGLRWNKTGGCEILLSSFVLLAGRDGEKRIMMVWICSYVILHQQGSLFCMSLFICTTPNACNA